MKIVVISEWFSENMSYAENNLPPALAKLGCEVHVVASDLQIYATDKNLYKIYEPFLGSPVVQTGIKSMNGIVLHRLPHYITKYGIGIRGLEEKLAQLSPDVVYVFEINMETTLQVVAYKPSLGYKIFAESRLHLSVYNPPKTFRSKLKHRFTARRKWKEVGRCFEKCYAVAPDVFTVVTKYFGQDKRKTVVSSLAVDMQKFYPVQGVADAANRKRLRTELGFAESDVVCIYSGRFTHDKGTMVLARAISLLQQQNKTHFKALFVGTGHEDFIEKIRMCSGCVVRPFVGSDELVNFYHAADIGVWPKQESTSQLDAIACGLTIIISSNVEDKIRITGNGLAYQHEDYKDLAAKIESLQNREERIRLGQAGLRKIRESYSWNFVAQSRINDFKTALQKRGTF